MQEQLGQTHLVDDDLVLGRMCLSRIVGGWVGCVCVELSEVGLSKVRKFVEVLEMEMSF